MKDNISYFEALEFITNEAKKNPDVAFDVGIHKPRRSLDSNSYFHALCDKLRQKIGISMARCKNQLITDYGQIMYLEEGVPLIYKTNAPPEYVQELEEPHLKLVKTTIENDKEVYFYRMYRGSHTYTTSEFKKLLQGTIDECEEQGIITATPAEIAHMQELWERKYGKVNSDGI